MQENGVIQENKMGTRPVNRLLVSMALPLMISMLVQALYNDSRQRICRTVKPGTR